MSAISVSFCRLYEELNGMRIGYLNLPCLLKCKVAGVNVLTMQAKQQTVMFYSVCFLMILPFLFLQLKPRDSDLCHCPDQCPLPEGS